MPAQRGQQTSVVRHHRAQLGHHVGHDFHGVLDQAQALAQTLAHLRGDIGGQCAADDIEVEIERGQVLADAVVQLLGQPPALILASLEQPLRECLKLVCVARELMTCTLALDHLAGRVELLN